MKEVSEEKGRYPKTILFPRSFTSVQNQTVPLELGSPFLVEVLLRGRPKKMVG